MSRIKSSKQLIFMYFSIVAFAVITVHMFIVESTVNYLEDSNGQIRLEIARDILRDHGSSVEPVELPPHTAVYWGEAELPADVILPDRLVYDRAREVFNPEVEGTYLFVMKSRVQWDGQLQTVFITNNDPVFERSEEKVFSWAWKQLIISFALLLITLWVVLKISARLAAPLTSLAQQLSAKKADDLSPVSLPQNGKTIELVQLADSLNDYQAQIKTVLERERSFNRFASHELRTPLMVIKGGLSLLGQSSDKDFIERQRQRMTSAVKETEDYVQTLLSLTRSEQEADEVWVLSRSELQTLVTEHKPLLVNKEVTCQLQVMAEPVIQAPEAAVKILLGNLLKNAFSYTDSGTVEVFVDVDSMTVQDTGRGMTDGNSVVHGNGLGLLLARDICRKYGWELEIDSEPENGSVVRVSGFDSKANSD